MKKLLKRIAPLLLALVMVLGSCLTVSAATSLPSTDKEYEAIIKEYQKPGFPYCIVYKSDSSVRFQFYDSEIFRKIINGKSSFFALNRFNLYYVTFSSAGSSVSNTFSYTPDVSVWNSSSAWSLVYSSFDIYDVGADKEKDEPFFRGPERPLVAAVRGAGPVEALKEVILLIPLSILFLAGCLGLRKGLRLLLTLLHRA